MSEEAAWTILGVFAAISGLVVWIDRRKTKEIQRQQMIWQTKQIDTVFHLGRKKKGGEE